MVMRHNIIRLTALLSLSLLFAIAPFAADAQVLNSPQSPLSDNYAWEKNVVGIDAVAASEPILASQPSGAAGSSQPPVEPGGGV